jgi:uncharacterized protein (TIGR00369 family)
VVHVHGPLRIVDDPAWLRGLVERLTTRYEANRADPWRVTDAPDAFIEGMLRGIVGLEVPISRIEGKWKVSQNRPAADRDGVIAGLRAAGGQERAAIAKLVAEHGDPRPGSEASVPPLTAEQLQRLVGDSGFTGSLALEVLSADPAAGEIAVRAAMRPGFERLTGSGQWHGGPIASIIDTAGDYALVMLTGRPVPTVNFRVDYLRPAVRTALRAVARVRRAGKTVGVVDVDVLDDAGELVAIGRASYALAPRG